MKHLLMIVPFFPPMAGGGVYRPLSFVKYLPRSGWRTTVVAPRGDAYWIRDDGLTAQIPQDCTVVRTSTLSAQGLLSRARRTDTHAAQARSSRGFGLLRRITAATVLPDTYLGWYPYALRAARKLLASTHFDALYSTSPPETSHLVASTLHREHGIPWVADFRDPWMNLYLLKPPTPVHARIHRHLERSVCRRADITVTTQWHEELLRGQYPSARVTRLPNGYDSAEIDAVLEHTPPDGVMRILHAGMLTQRRSADAFLQALKLFRDRRPEAASKIEVLFVGPREDANDRAASQYGVGDLVRFIDSLPHVDTLKMERSSHILLLIKHANPDYDGLVPGKLYEYAGVRRPILALVPEGEAKRRVDEWNRGETAPPDDPEAVADRIALMFDKYAAGSLENGYDLGSIPEFERSGVAADMAALLDRVSSGETAERG